MGQEPFETVVAAHHDEIYRYLVRATGRPSDAEDLWQETFLRAYRAYRALTPDANVRAWLFAIATNLFRNHFRAEGRRRAAHATVRMMGEGRDHHGPEAETLFNEGKALIEASIARLPVKQRLAFVLRRVHDLDYEAIGHSLGCSAEAARANVFQAMRKIRQTLNGHQRPDTEPLR